jgi:hypothetical protein
LVAPGGSHRPLDRHPASLRLPVAFRRDHNRMGSKSSPASVPGGGVTPLSSASSASSAVPSPTWTPRSGGHGDGLTCPPASPRAGLGLILRPTPARSPRRP